MKRIIVVTLGLAAPILALAAPAMAGPRDDVLYGISRCGGISDDRIWLDCVYGAAQPMRAQLGLSPAPASQQKLVPPGMPGMAAPAQNFSGGAQPVYKPTFLERMLPKDYEPDPPTTLASYSFDAIGLFTVTLANGQRWKQEAGDTQRAVWTKRPQSYPAQVMLDTAKEGQLRVGPQLFIVSKD